MAVFLNNKVGLKIGTVDLSDRVTSLTINRSFDELETTSMGSGGHTFVKGLESGSISIDFLNDTEANEVLQTLQSVWGTNAVIKVIQDATGTPTVSAANPLYTMTCLINNTTDVNGAVGDLGVQSLSFNVSGTIAVATTGTW
jgi:hypothetical protein